MFHGKLTRLTAGEGSAPIRTESASGFFYDEPKVGEQFMIIGEPLPSSPADVTNRYVKTSPIKRVYNHYMVSPDINWFDQSLQFQTESGSVYELEYYDATTKN